PGGNPLGVVQPGGKRDGLAVLDLEDCSIPILVGDTHNADINLAISADADTCRMVQTRGHGLGQLVCGNSFRGCKQSTDDSDGHYLLHWILQDIFPTMPTRRFYNRRNGFQSDADYRLLLTRPSLANVSGDNKPE